MWSSSSASSRPTSDVSRPTGIFGRAAAVADLNGRHLTGLPAWLAWLFVHLFFLIQFQNRVLVMLQWAWNYFTWDRGPRLIFSLRRPLPAGEGLRP